MSSISCIIPECKDTALFSCSCSEKAFICQFHISSHLLSLGNHIPTNLVTIAPENLKQKVFDYFTNSQKQIRNSIQTIHQFSNKTIDLISDQDRKACQTLIREQNNLMMSFIKFLKSLYLVKDYTEKFINDEDHNIQEFESNSDKIVKELKNWCNRNIIKENMDDDKYALIFNTIACHYITFLDLDTHTKSIVSFCTKDLVYYCACTKIDNNKFLLYGGEPQNMQTLVKIVDITRKKVEILAPSTPLYLASSCFYNGEVYIFGGTAGRYTPTMNCKKYNIINKNWINIQSMPEPNYGTTASLIDEGGNLIERQKIIEEGGFLNSNYSYTRQKYIYFILIGRRVYRINIESKSLESINTDYL